MAKNRQTPIIRAKSKADFQRIHQSLTSKGFVAIDMLRPGRVRDVALTVADAAQQGATSMAASMGCGEWSNGPLSKVAWSFDARVSETRKDSIKDAKGKEWAYIPWGPTDSTPSVIPPLAMSSPYTGAPLRYLANLTAGLGLHLMYRFPDDTLCEMRNAGYRILERIEKLRKAEQADPYGGDEVNDPATGFPTPITSLPPERRPAPKPMSIGIDYWQQRYDEWQRTWEGYNNDQNDDAGVLTQSDNDPGARAFMENNDLDLLLLQCMQDDVMLDISFPMVGFQRGRRGVEWNPKITYVGFRPSHSMRLCPMGQDGVIRNALYSDHWRTKGGGPRQQAIGVTDKTAEAFDCVTPQYRLNGLRDIVAKNRRKSPAARPLWVCCPVYYPSGNKPYYPQPYWWSVFTSKAFDFSATVLYDKWKQRENSTSWSKIVYISLDYLNECMADRGEANNDPQVLQDFIDELDKQMEEFLQRRDNNGKMMRQFMWTGQDGKEHKNVEIVDVADASHDMVKAGKEELELSTNPIFLALGVDPRLVGVPMVAASNGGTALREMALIKAQELAPKQRLFLRFMQTINAFNGWVGEWVIKQQSFTTLDNSKTGVVETIAGEGA